MIVEPLLQGAGGMVVWPAEALRRIAELCRQHQVYLIFDEVMTGFGRTGSLFAMDRIGVVPDLVCLSKGLTGGTLPLAATLATEEIYSAFLADEKVQDVLSRPFVHGKRDILRGRGCKLASVRVGTHARKNRAHRRSFNAENSTLSPRHCRFATLAVRDGRGVRPSGREKTISQMRAASTESAMSRGLFIRPLGQHDLPHAALLRDRGRSPDGLADIENVYQRSLRHLRRPPFRIRK